MTVFANATASTSSSEHASSNPGAGVDNKSNCVRKRFGVVPIVVFVIRRFLAATTSSGVCSSNVRGSFLGRVRFC